MKGIFACALQFEPAFETESVIVGFFCNFNIEIGCDTFCDCLKLGEIRKLSPRAFKVFELQNTCRFG